MGNAQDELTKALAEVVALKKELARVKTQKRKLRDQLDQNLNNQLNK